MTVLLKVSVVELMIQQSGYCVTENPLALNIHIYMMHSVILKTPKIVCECVCADCYAAPI
jgi:hypothetical protein